MNHVSPCWNKFLFYNSDVLLKCCVDSLVLYIQATKPALQLEMVDFTESIG